ncbi:putative secreted protein (Por secretion system target) [Oceanihabitans sediminis]|uniref:T9SS C-terminal target domain-containing protein n=1 Tax=Oceanihabitans sediminis TaxID=1812012 RepID=A0A368P565_9FLAO|nr:endonuclease [Oceanihabitans sediminis]RBP29025.1 putative secreted protein (Por secretion system target) [Oceanihabitans sediminis]RCU57045.1 T9SS C-terminal target domain-containing protein [Oceanihabitans sediminis]
MKQIYFILALLLSYSVSAQIPSDYYDTATGTGFTLKTQLKDIISNGHTARTYDQLYDGAGISNSQGYVDTHSDLDVTGGANYENDGTVLDFYSENPNGPDPYNFTHNLDEGGNQTAEGDCYNREHIIPQSSFNSNFPMQSDIHHVIPTDCRVNNFRGSFPFGNVASDNWTSQNGSKRGTSAMQGYSGTVFEPIDEFKGDIARAILYFATRYEDNIHNYTSFDMFNGTNDQVFHTWAIDVLLDWHYNVDPVDQREIERNKAAYRFQGNANPFVDHPEYANLIWNPNAGDTEAPSTPLNLVASNPTDDSIHLTWTASTDNVAVTEYNIYVDGETISSFSTSETNFTVTGLTPATEYCFTITAKDAADNESGVSNQACETTTNNGSTGGGSEIYFSEYIEGSSFNKVLEIANFTGENINDLSAYTLKLGTNGGGTWGTTYTFPQNATIANQDVYVIANGSSTVCPSQYDDLNTDITSFNGNDAIGLFKNDVLIDLIGDLNSSANFGKDVTLIRKPEITEPSTTFDINEWNSLSRDDCSNLGSHTQNLSTNNFSQNEVKILPNPVENILKIKFDGSQETKIEIFDILGKKVFTKTLLQSQNIQLDNLKSGVYIMKLTQGKATITKKLIKK